ncbi:MAG TPA: menaquinone biosynthesis protein [Bacteroidales bacterium]|nr:menaquinone biosynthesis protein [Bacteroidales bacterium]HRZ76422.1 menaquinone biosynthesis protein [Bacteroidales bacterium]
MRITAVSYLNTLPFLHGIRCSGLLEEHRMELAVPSECARRLRDGETDLALVPVGAVPEMHGARIVTRWCLGADGPVGSVFLVSALPPADLQRVFLDTDSRTSVLLARLLLAERWLARPELVRGLDGFRPEEPGADGAVVIGDKAFAFIGAMPRVFDLSSEWKTHTGLPFVFAVWMAADHVAPGFLEVFDKALEYGVRHIPEALKGATGLQRFPDPLGYLTRSISYPFGPDKQKALEAFLYRAGALKD